MGAVNILGCVRATTISRRLRKFHVHSYLELEKGFRARHLLPPENAGNRGFIDAHELGNLRLLDPLAFHLGADSSDFLFHCPHRRECARSVAWAQSLVARGGWVWECSGRSEPSAEPPAGAHKRGVQACLVGLRVKGDE